MITPREPRDMTAAERRAEIARILAVGYLRLQVLRVHGENGLADARPAEASCGPKPMNPRSTETTA